MRQTNAYAYLSVFNASFLFILGKEALVVKSFVAREINEVRLVGLHDEFRFWNGVAERGEAA
jgi:hypothetical protein